MIILVGSFFIGAAWFYLRPAFRSEASIRTSLLAEMPVGSSMTEVRALAEKRGWIEPGVKFDSYTIVSTGTTGVSVTAFSGRLRPDPFPYRTEVGATWQFDQSNRLFDIRVSRYGFE